MEGERYRQETEAYRAYELGDDYCWTGHRAEVCRMKAVDVFLNVLEARLFA